MLAGFFYSPLFICVSHSPVSPQVPFLASSCRMKRSPHSCFFLGGGGGENQADDPSIFFPLLNWLFVTIQPAFPCETPCREVSPPRGPALRLPYPSPRIPQEPASRRRCLGPAAPQEQRRAPEDPQDQPSLTRLSAPLSQKVLHIWLGCQRRACRGEDGEDLKAA